MQIGDLARATDTRVVTIRYYEKIGLIAAPPRTNGNYRDYEPAARERLHFIRRCRALGFSLDEIRELISLSAKTEGPCDKVGALTSRHIREVEAKIADLQKLAGELRAIRHSCTGGRPMPRCGILKALGESPEAEG